MQLLYKGVKVAKLVIGGEIVSERSGGYYGDGFEVAANHAELFAAIAQKAAAPLPATLAPPMDFETAGKVHEAALDYFCLASVEAAYHRLDRNVWAACAVLDGMAKFVLCRRQVAHGVVCISRAVYVVDERSFLPGEPEERYRTARSGELLDPQSVEKLFPEDTFDPEAAEELGPYLGIPEIVAGLNDENRIKRPPFTLYPL